MERKQLTFQDLEQQMRSIENAREGEALHLICLRSKKPLQFFQHLMQLASQPPLNLQQVVSVYPAGLSRNTGMGVEIRPCSIRWR